MAQYDVYPNPSPRSRDEIPYVVDVQSDLLADLRTRLVMPLAVTGAQMTQAPRRLSPTFVVEGRLLAALPHLASGVQSRHLKRPVSSLSAHAADLRDALDGVVSGV